MIAAFAADDRDAIDVMDDMIDEFAVYVGRTARAQARSRKYRANLLWVHAAAALFMAPGFAALGQAGMAGAAWTYLRQVPYSPYSIATIIGAGGLFLGAGIVADKRRIEIIGLAFLATFYLIIAIGFGAANIGYYVHHDTGPKPAPYAPFLYLHLTIVMGVHMGTLIRRQGKRG